MTREWITDFNKMGFTEEEKELALKVFNADPSSTLYFDGDKNYLWEDEREDNYFTKETLLENLAITFEEWEKEGMFDEEDFGELPAALSFKGKEVLDGWVTPSESEAGMTKAELLDNINDHFTDIVNDYADSINAKDHVFGRIVQSKFELIQECLADLVIKIFSEEDAEEYEPTESGIKTFIKEMYSDTFNALDNDEQPPVPVIVIGTKQIRLYDCPAVLEGIEAMLLRFIDEQINC